MIGWRARSWGAQVCGSRGAALGRQPCLGKLEADAQRSRSCLPSRLHVPTCLCPGRELFKACKDVGRDRL